MQSVSISMLNNAEHILNKLSSHTHSKVIMQQKARLACANIDAAIIALEHEIAKDDLETIN